MSIRKRKYIILALLVLVAVTSACVGEIEDEAQEETSSGEKEQVEEEVIEFKNEIVLTMRNPQSLNPITNIDKSIDQTLNLIFEKLVKIDENDRVVPNIAKSWSLNEDRTVVDITLNSDIKWHDGSGLVAEDIVYSISKIQEAATSPYKFAVKNIISSRALEDGKVRIVYNQGFSGYEYRLCFPIIPSHLESIDENPVGTGPYKFVEWENNKHMLLTSNENYHLGQAKIEKIKVLATEEDSGDLYSFDQGIIDVVNTDIIDREKHTKNNKSNINEYNTLYYDYLAFNFNKEIFADKKTRQALMEGLDREYLLNEHYLGHGILTNVPVSPKSWLYEPESKVYNYDKKKAKEFFKDKNLDFDLMVIKDNPERLGVTKSIQKMYKDIGVTVNIVEEEKEDFMGKIQAGNYDMFIGGWKFSVVPDLSFAFHSSMIGQTNYINYSNETMDNLLGKAFLAKNNESLQKAYSKLQENISEELPYLSLYFKTAALLTDNRIKGNIKPHHLNIYNNIHEWHLVDVD